MPLAMVKVFYSQSFWCRDGIFGLWIDEVEAIPKCVSKGSIPEADMKCWEVKTGIYNGILDCQIIRCGSKLRIN